MAKASFTLLILAAALLSVAFSKIQVIREGEYTLEWEVDNENITVTAVAKTLGYVGFGISPFGTMMDADIVLSGRYSNGTGYIQDSWAFANSGPERDDVQNVQLISATENATHTTVTFTRKLVADDLEQDKSIVNATQSIIWSYGPTDSFQYHGPNRGVVSINLVEA
ncbi:DBH-like monooxygenase protein 1 [Orchesella cincta]|uniref:DBH-like monooxygenase protein 1 n=1 Tax=Orchesella cincta TaxID=48709 RepID=A0A1D2MYZ8_ORCCI|nr:DBH-like monooxygenase protein 1 [Orchesella cincta]